MSMVELPELSKAELEELFRTDRNKFMALVSVLIDLQVQYARTDINHFVQFVMQDEKSGAFLRQDPAHIELQRFIDTNQYSLIWGGVGVGKAQPLTCKVLTTSGWKFMGDLKVGDEVIDPDGGTGAVQQIHPQGERPVWAVNVQGGRWTRASADHLWSVMVPPLRGTVTVTTGTMRSLLQEGHKVYLPVHGAGFTEVASITEERPTTVQCISVSTKRNLYVTDDCIVTHNCVVDSTKFLLHDGRQVRLDELRELFNSNRRRGLKTYVKTLTDAGELIDVPVKDIFDNGVQDVHRVVTQSGHTTTVSWNHPFRTMRHRFHAIEHGELEWVHPTQMQGALSPSKKYTPDTVVVSGPVPSARTRSDGLDEQEAWDLGFMVGLFDAKSTRRMTYRQVDGSEVWAARYGGDARSHKITAAITSMLEEIASRRGFHLSVETKPSTTSVRDLVVAKMHGTSWLERRGVSFDTQVRSVNRKSARRASRPTKIRCVTVQATRGYLLDGVIESGPAACRAYLAGLLVHLTEDKEWQHIAAVTVSSTERADSLVELGHACRVATRHVTVSTLDHALNVRRSKMVLFESPSLLSVYDVIRRKCPPAWGYFSGVDDHVRHCFATEPPADTYNLQNNKKYNKAFKKYGKRHKRTSFLRQWTPKSESLFQMSTVLSCHCVGQQQTWGVEIDTEEHTHLTDGFLTHNTQQVTVARVLWSLGRNVNLRVLIAMSKADLAKDPMGQIKKMIEESDRLHRVFPDLKRGNRWTEHEILVQRTLILNSPSVRAIGAGTKIDGSRYDLIILDDVLSLDNTSSQGERDKLMKWIESVPMSRMEHETLAIIIGNAFHNDDPMHRFERMQNTIWKARRFPARDPVTKKTLFPRRWPDEKIAQWERSRTPQEVRRAIDCVPFSNESSRFHLDWFEVALDKGKNVHFEDGEHVHFLSKYNLQEEQEKVQTARDKLNRLDRQVREELLRSGRRQEAVDMPDSVLPPMPVGVFSGVDLGFGMSERADQTVIFTVVVFDDGTLRVINIERGRWQPPVTINMLVQTHADYGSEIFMEAHYTQRFVYDIVKHEHPDLPVYPWDTRGTGTIGNKWHAIFGIESVAVDIGFGRWVLPCVVPQWKQGDDEDEKNRREIHPLVRDFIDACLYFVPDSTVHTDDILMAAWISLQGARQRGGHDYLSALVDISPYYTDEQDDDIFRESSGGAVVAGGLWDELRDLFGKED